jgi:competence ComEA-like helix-hairpin-helix protein
LHKAHLRFVDILTQLKIKSKEKFMIFKNNWLPNIVIAILTLILIFILTIKKPAPEPIIYNGAVDVPELVLDNQEETIEEADGTIKTSTKTTSKKKAEKPTPKPKATPTPGKLTAAEGIKININTAGVGELRRLSGIGEATAKKIIEYRETSGAFTQISDIKKVNGIGNAKFETIKDLIEI